jgi:hypothetical protein
MKSEQDLRKADFQEQEALVFNRFNSVSFPDFFIRIPVIFNIEKFGESISIFIHLNHSILCI